TYKEDAQRERAMLDTILDTLSVLPDIKINGKPEAPHILSLSIPGVPTQNTINILQDAGICVSAGSACAKGHRSHVLTAMGLQPEVIDGAFRVSLCKDTSFEEIHALLNGLHQVLDWKNSHS
ncbi:MAG: aminotransferase class V-fold PLP-dependent enzyme, partial [Oscillospiraceae bacterium]|nr:aminotransferase class V-fold PLP-dependent enzyme [Oscillospiraceae bacterium]